jgi:hypothetical protein
VLFSLLLLFSGCTRRYLTARTEYLTPEYLASSQVRTPDPRQEAFLGEQIVVHWDLPFALLREEPQLHLSVRFVDRDIKEFSFPVRVRRGYLMVPFLNEEDLCRGGVLSYKIEVSVAEKCWTAWRHHLWVDIISVN